MISAIGTNNNKINFHGTTIIKNKDGSHLDKEILDAADKLRGIVQTFDDYSIVIAGKMFKEKEKAFLKTLDAKDMDYNYSSKVLNYKSKTFSIESVKKMIQKVVKLELL